VPLRPIQERSLHPILVEALIDTQSLLARLERGVQVRQNGQRGVVRQLYVATRNQAKALIATLEFELMTYASTSSDFCCQAAAHQSSSENCCKAAGQG
jgi:hypothetical protein